MVQARRAKVRPARVIIPLVVAAALLVGGSFAAVKFSPDATTAGPEPESSATVESQAPSTAVSSPSTPTPSPTAKPASAESKKALEACQERVDAADDVLKQGKKGAEHWTMHVQAQKDNLDGKISVEEMRARFKATRLKGLGDLKRYADALSNYSDLKGSCGKALGADREVAAALKKCDQRSKDQQPFMQATAGAMKDWKAHQKLMQLNKEHQAGTPSDAQAAWLKQYHAASKNINAFKKAQDHFKAPTC